ncbi:hypothetical protein H4R20_001639 [Coemansia guatemalensis]|uniref:Protein kinase domain-containing protein n=1 Tax=Coemansia guatemalensis TaxID=2761395 RepID=A0A9W8I5G1_9FUNG|nr:hypothetical protein H4R20_001639 [Coemansia guatemalensis]
MENTRELIEADILRRVTSHFGQDFVLLDKVYELENIKFGHINRVVHKAQDGDGKIVAIKIIDTMCGRKHRQLALLNNVMNELHTLDLVKDKTSIPVTNILKVVIDDQYIFQVMDFIEGNRLSCVYDSLDKPTLSAIEKQLREYISQLRGVGEDGKTLIHGDLGTYNIMVNGDKVSALIDWEVSREGEEGEELEIVSARAWGDNHKEFIANILR